MNMGDKIKQRRTELKMTQEDLAEKLNVSRSSVANWEASRMKICSHYITGTL